MLGWDVIVLNGYLLLNAHLRLSVLPLPGIEDGQVVLYSLRVCDRLGGLDPYRYGISLCWVGRAAILEFVHRRTPFPRLGLHRRARSDHPGDASGAPHHCFRSR